VIRSSAAGTDPRGRAVKYHFVIGASGAFLAGFILGAMAMQRNALELPAADEPVREEIVTTLKIGDKCIVRGRFVNDPAFDFLREREIGDAVSLSANLRSAGVEL
jgi:hypothetical protein